MTLIFFPVKAEIPYFSKINKGDQKGDHQKICSGLNNWSQTEKIKKLQNFKSKINPLVVPLLVPLIDFRKIWNLSFHWKKIMFLSFLVNFLHFFEIALQNGPKSVTDGVFCVFCKKRNCARFPYENGFGMHCEPPKVSLSNRAKSEDTFKYPPHGISTDSGFKIRIWNAKMLLNSFSWGNFQNFEKIWKMSFFVKKCRTIFFKCL